MVLYGRPPGSRVPKRLYVCWTDVYQERISGFRDAMPVAMQVLEAATVWAGVFTMFLACGVNELKILSADRCLVDTGEKSPRLDLQALVSL
jgi:hypothetical protein